MQHEPGSGRAIRVGLVILAAFAALAAGIFLIGDKNNMFRSKNRYSIEFNSVSGVKPGSPVQLNGVDVGTVEEVSLPQEPTVRHIQVWIKVDARYADLIRGATKPLAGRPAGATMPGSSQARIKTLGLLGDKYIEISTGAPGLPVIPNEGEIPAAQPTNVDALLASGEDVMDNVVEISASLSTILGRMERGEGLLGELTSSESESGQRIRASIVGTSESMERIANKIDAGEGPLGRLLNDRAMADQLATSLDRFEALVAQAQGGPGLAPALLNDAAMKTSVQDTLAQLNQVSNDLKKVSGNLETSEALLPKLVNDDEYGREVTQELREIVDRLNEASLKLTRGEGTAAKLLNDPQIYDAVNDVIIGVNESRILRWLIRNRQKKGIEKRYEEARQEMEARGETPPPLDKGPDVIEEAPADPPAEATPVPEATPPEALTPDPSPAPPSTPPPGEGRPLTSAQDPPSPAVNEVKSPPLPVWACSGERERGPGGEGIGGEG